MRHDLQELDQKKKKRDACKQISNDLMTMWIMGCCWTHAWPSELVAPNSSWSHGAAKVIDFNGEQMCMEIKLAHPEVLPDPNPSASFVCPFFSAL
jgi:hypothetical protein